MKNRSILAVLVIVVILMGCSTTLKPSYSSTDPDAMRIGNEKPEDKASEVMNMGSFCQEVSHRWNEDGKTPDGQKVWSKAITRKIIPCP